MQDESVTSNTSIRVTASTVCQSPRSRHHSIVDFSSNTSTSSTSSVYGRWAFTVTGTHYLTVSMIHILASNLFNIMKHPEVLRRCVMWINILLTYLQWYSHYRSTELMEGEWRCSGREFQVIGADKKPSCH